MLFRSTLAGIKGVLFDVYGTLFQSAAGEISLHHREDRSTPFYRVAHSLDRSVSFDRVEALARRYYERIDEVHAARKGLGVSYPEVDIVTIWHGLLEEFPELRRVEQSGRFPQAKWLALRYELEANPVAAMPGAAEIIPELRRREFLVGLISNAQFYTPLLFPPILGGAPEELGVAHAVWSFQVGAAKPAEQLYRRSIDWFGEVYHIRPEELLMVGNDMRNDIAPAAALGMKTALFGGDRRSLRLRREDPSLREVQPDLLLTSLTQLYEVLP